MSSWSDDPDTITVIRQPTTYRDTSLPKRQARNLDQDKSHNTLASTATHLRHSHAENNPSTQNQQMRNRQDLNTSSPSTYSVTANVISLAHEENGERILHENTTATFANLSLTSNGSNSQPTQNSQLPVYDKFASISKPEEAKDSKQESSEDREAATKTEDEFEFQVFATEPLPNLTYSVKHRDEDPSSHGARWQQCPARMKIFNNEKIGFKIDDVVRLSLSNDSHGKIVEIREGLEPYAVLQWAYNKSQARRYGIGAGEAKLWPLRTYYLSNHYQIIPGGSIDSLSKIKLGTEIYFDARVDKRRKSMSE